MSFNDLLADLDETAFEELADDNAAIWQPAGGSPFVVAAMLDTGQRRVDAVNINLIGEGPMIRLSVAQVAAVSDGLKPGEGDTITINGVVHIVHGEPWRDDEMNGRDWLCPATV